MADSVGMEDLRAENVSAVVTSFALQKYVLKNLTTFRKIRMTAKRVYGITFINPQDESIFSFMKRKRNSS